MFKVQAVGRQRDDLYWGYMGIMEKKMETTRVIRVIYRDYGVYWGYMGNNGKENGNYYSILGLYGGNGKENGNCYSVLVP